MSVMSHGVNAVDSYVGLGSVVIGQGKALPPSKPPLGAISLVESGLSCGRLECLREDMAPGRGVARSGAHCPSGQDRRRPTEVPPSEWNATLPLDIPVTWNL